MRIFRGEDIWEAVLERECLGGEDIWEAVLGLGGEDISG